MPEPIHYAIMVTLIAVCLPMLDRYFPVFLNHPLSITKPLGPAFGSPRTKDADRTSNTWPHIVRLFAGFLGISWASTKLSWTRSGELGASFGLVGLGVWFLVDRTIRGFLVGLLVSATIMIMLSGLRGYRDAEQLIVYGTVAFANVFVWGAIGRKMLPVDNYSLS